MFATQFDIQGKCNIQACQFFIVHDFANIYIFISLMAAMERGFKCLDDPLSFIG